MKRLFPLYHWAPADRRKSIMRLGLCPNKRSSHISFWRPPYLCFSDSPSLAWGLSAAVHGDKGSEWDLWMTWSTEAGKLTRLTHFNRTYPAEYRTEQRIFKRNIWFVGTRTL